jgi:hypothetical protein
MAVRLSALLLLLLFLLFFWKDQIREDEVSRACSMRKERSAYKVPVENTEDTRQLGRLRHRRGIILTYLKIQNGRM